MSIDEKAFKLVKLRLPQIQKALENGRSSSWVYKNIFFSEKAAGTINHKQIEDTYLRLTKQTMTETRNSAKKVRATESTGQETKLQSFDYRRFVRGVDLSLYKGAKDVPQGIVDLVLDDLEGSYE